MQRLRVCCQVAEGIVYLHTEDTARHKPVILHRDVKPANILLDCSLNARLADPGMALVAPELGAGGGHTHVSSTR
jgi:serine/threonine protein kinase